MPRVTVYNTQPCPYGIMVKKYLEENGIEYEYVDVSKDMNSLKEIVEKSGQNGVPVTDIDGKIIVGFDKKAIDEALGL